MVRWEWDWASRSVTVWIGRGLLVSEAGGIQSVQVWVPAWEWVGEVEVRVVLVEDLG